MRIDENDNPMWRDGDVVKMRFVRKRDRNSDGLLLSDEYTYTRRDGYWPGEMSWATHTDDEMTAAWHDSRLAAVMIAAVVGLEPADQPEPLPQQFWYTAYNDHSGYAVFASELEALRYAHEKQMDIVEQRTWGELR